MSAARLLVVRLIVLAGLLGAVIGSGGCTQLTLDHARLKGYNAYQDKDYQRARDYFADCVEGDATDWKAQYYLGRTILDGFDEPTEARRHLEIADEIRRSRPDVALAPRAGSTQAAVPFPTIDDLAAAMAEAMYREGDNDRLVVYLKQTANQYGEVSHYLRLGEYLERLGDHDGARTAFHTAARLSPKEDASAYLALADFLDRVGDREAALEILRRGYGWNPSERGIEDRIRAHGAVPGPTFALPPLE